LKVSPLLRRFIPVVAVASVVAYSFLFRGPVTFSSSPVACGYGLGTSGCGWIALHGGFLSGPDAASSTGSLAVFGRGLDNGLWYSNSGNGGSTFSPWVPLGGIITAAPGAVGQPGTTKVDVFARGQDNQLWQIEATAGVWGAWTPRGGGLAAGTGPDATSRSAGVLDVFIEGQDKQLWQFSLPSATWTPLGGIITADPGAVSESASNIDVFARGQDKQLWERVWTTSSWGAWMPLGGGLASGPDPASSATGKVDVFIQGMDNQLWTWTAGAWTPHGGIVTADPGATSHVAGSDDVFVRGQDNAYYYSTFATS
jgi:hypothetical protein